MQPDLALALRAGRRPTAPRTDAPLYALPTYTAMLALRELLIARGEARSAWSVSAREVVWHELECGSYRADLPLWRELADGAARSTEAPRGSSMWARAPAAWRSSRRGPAIA